MSAHPILEEILRLPPDQWLRLAEDIWESLAASPTGVPMPEWHREVLDERLADPREEVGRTWDDVQANARRARRQIFITYHTCNYSGPGVERAEQHDGGVKIAG